MNNKILSFLILIGFVLNVAGQEAETTKIRRKAISSLNIQYAKTYDYSYKFGEIDKKSVFLSAIKKFNKKGNAIEDQFIYKNGWNLIHLYEYDSNNNLKKIIIKNTDGTIKELTKFFYVNGLQKEEYIYSGDGNLSKKYIYEYDSTNRIIEIICYDIIENSKFNSTYTYTDNGEKIENIFNSNGDMTKYFKTSSYPNNCIYTQSVNKENEINENKFELLNKEYELYENKFEFLNILGQDTLMESTKYYANKTYTTKKIVKKFNNNNLLVQLTMFVNDEPTFFQKTEYIKFQPN